VATANSIFFRTEVVAGAVLDIPCSERIVPANVAALSLPRQHHLLLKTRNSNLLRTNVFDHDYCYLAPERSSTSSLATPGRLASDYYSLDPRIVKKPKLRVTRVG